MFDDNKGRSPYNGRLSDFSFYIDSQISVHRSFILNEFCSRFVMAVSFILSTVRRSSVGSFVERDFFIRILFQVYQYIVYGFVGSSTSRLYIKVGII
jgi:hypothetical protein